MNSAAWYTLEALFVCYVAGVVCNARNITGIRFLVTVNDTWADPPGCITTVPTGAIKPNVPATKSENITVGACDHGPLNYSLMSPGKDGNKYTVSLTFYSSVIEDAEPPVCDISWNGTYLVPKKPTNESTGRPDADLLPSCYTTDSREGNFLTYYWFHLLEWQFD